MPLLSRMLASPLHVDVRSGALAAVPHLLSDGRIAGDGRFALVVGTHLGATVVRGIGREVPSDHVFVVGDDDVETAFALASAMQAKRLDAVVAVGGGRTVDVAKLAASRLGLPLVVVATSLAHDGIASPVSVLTVGGIKTSFGAAMPVAVSVDLDFVAESPRRMVRAGIGDVISNLGAVADWRLAHDVRGEPIDGLAASFATTAANAVLHHDQATGSSAFLESLADALILSGMAMSVAGTSRPCSGACHEISHAIDELYPGSGLHGEQVGVGALFASMLRGDEAVAQSIGMCLVRHGLPTSPLDLGLSNEAFIDAVLHGPSTRPDRYTILEHLEPSRAQLSEHLARMAALCRDVTVGVV